MVKKSILEGTLWTDGFFAWFRLVLHHSNYRRQFWLRNFWFRLKIVQAHCVTFVMSTLSIRIKFKVTFLKLWEFQQIHLFLHLFASYLLGKVLNSTKNIIQDFHKVLIFNKLANTSSLFSTAFWRERKSLNLSVRSHAYTKGSKEFQFQRPISGKTEGEASHDGNTWHGVVRCKDLNFLVFKTFQFHLPQKLWNVIHFYLSLKKP